MGYFFFPLILFTNVRARFQRPSTRVLEAGFQWNPFLNSPFFFFRDSIEDALLPSAFFFCISYWPGVSFSLAHLSHLLSSFFVFLTRFLDDDAVRGTETFSSRVFPPPDQEASSHPQRFCFFMEISSNFALPPISATAVWFSFFLFFCSEKKKTALHFSSAWA